MPLASGLLTGKFTEKTTFSEGDHRFFNVDGKFFDRGETFSGIDFKKGLDAVSELKNIFSDGPLALYALRWILMFPEVSCIIPGASRHNQAEMNAHASELPPMTDEQMMAVRRIYETYIKPDVHHLW